MTTDERGTLSAEPPPDPPDDADPDDSDNFDDSLDDMIRYAKGKKMNELVKETRIVKYDISQEQIELKRVEYSALPTVTDGKSYELKRKARADLRQARVNIEVRRKELKADALEWGRLVDSKAKELTGLIESIEDPIAGELKAFDDAKEAEKRAEEARKKAEMEAKVRAEQEAEAARLKAIHEAEQRALAEERRQQEERNRLAREAIEREEAEARARIATEQRKAKEAADKERAEVEAAQAKLAADRRASELAEQQRREKVLLEEQAKQWAEQQAREAEEARVAELERQAALKARLDELRPDREKIAAYCAAVRAVAMPELKDLEAQLAVSVFLNDLSRLLEQLDLATRLGGNVSEVA